jgi:DNA-binding response OmpR family regulator
MDKPLILFVDDDPDIQSAIKSGLESRDYHVVVASSGKEALKLLESAKPDLMIIDLRMEPMNGFELHTEVRKNLRLEKIPVFFLTAVDDSLAKKYGQKLGVAAYLTKPVDIHDLDLRIRKSLTPA